VKGSYVALRARSVNVVFTVKFAKLKTCFLEVLWDLEIVGADENGKMWVNVDDVYVNFRHVLKKK
jgi:hypothetical protein